MRSRRKNDQEDNDINVGNKNDDSGDVYEPRSDNTASSSNDDEEHPPLGSDTEPGDTGNGSSETHEPEAVERISPAKFVAGARRSTRQRRQPSEWWKATALSSVAVYEPLSFSAATKGENADSWQAAIKTELRCY